MPFSASNLPFPGFRGEVTTEEAWNLLQKEKGAMLVDVRTEHEWDFIGVPDLAAVDKVVVKLSWRLLPEMELNTEFEKTLMAQIPSRETPIYFMCKGGGRSAEAAAAMTQLGYTQCYNILGGFEGRASAPQHKGWQQANLPWSKA